MEQSLTDRSFWEGYWESKKDIIQPISAKNIFNKPLTRLLQKHKPRKAIELGGFPGFNAIYLKKFHGIDTDVLDFFIHRPICEKLLSINGLKEEDMGLIEGDVYNVPANNHYNMVCSFGLIEHFNDTKDILEQHLKFLAPGGTLFITMPNFTGTNGWVQKQFDKENYDKHNIACMNPRKLIKDCKELGMEEVKSYYWGGFSVWLEHKDQKSIFVRALVRSIWIIGKVLSKIIRRESKIGSPYIVIEAIKPFR